MLALALVLPAVGCGEGDDATTDDSATEGPTTEGETIETTEGETSETGETMDTEDAGSESESESSGDPSETESESDSDTTDSDTTEGGVSFAGSIYPDIITASCSCHIGGGSGGLAMPDADTAYSNLVSVAASQNPDLNRVEPGSAASSYLINKLEGTQTDAGGSGQQMPLGGSLDQGSIDAIAEWINSGANP